MTWNYHCCVLCTLSGLKIIADWAYILDHYNYARWFPVYVRNIINLQIKHPDLYNHFAEGFFAFAKTQNPFSLIGFDHKIEQQNKQLKIFYGGNPKSNDESSIFFLNDESSMQDLSQNLMQTSKH